MPLGILTPEVAQLHPPVGVRSMPFFLADVVQHKLGRADQRIVPNHRLLDWNGGKTIVEGYLYHLGTCLVVPIIHNEEIRREEEVRIARLPLDRRHAHLGFVIWLVRVPETHDRIRVDVLRARSSGEVLALGDGDLQYRWRLLLPFLIRIVNNKSHFLVLESASSPRSLNGTPSLDSSILDFLFCAICGFFRVVCDKMTNSSLFRYFANDFVVIFLFLILFCFFPQTRKPRLKLDYFFVDQIDSLLPVG
mmetsp:Transcript_28768/g.58947  ORF Transcript_28768/g.58947 Transcript_28768/m.58947 type:complete len:249 (-) Transcript_28768:362-1108(-)